MKTQIAKHGAAMAVAEKRVGHTRPKAPIINLEQPGRLRVCHVISLFGVSHSTWYAGLKSGRYPAADGFDGRMPYWHTETIRPLL